MWCMQLQNASSDEQAVNSGVFASKISPKSHEISQKYRQEGECQQDSHGGQPASS